MSRFRDRPRRPLLRDLTARQVDEMREAYDRSQELRHSREAEVWDELRDARVSRLERQPYDDGSEAA